MYLRHIVARMKSTLQDFIAASLRLSQPMLTAYAYRERGRRAGHPSELQALEYLSPKPHNPQWLPET